MKPWTYFRLEDGSFLIIDGSHEFQKTDGHSVLNRHVALVYPIETDIPGDTSKTEAVASLLAAAPDLYAACLLSMQQLHNIRLDEKSRDVAFIKKAIKRVKGIK